jgi:probable HAF family extracellular repeat protein
MKSTQLFSAAIGLGGALALATGADAANSYVVYDLGALQGESIAYAINDGGSVVGAGPGGGGTSWIWDRRSGMRSLGTFPGGNGNARATAINNSGTVVGFAEVAVEGPFTQAFRWTAQGGMQPIPGIGPGSTAFGINDAGEIVGGDAAVVGNGYLWNRGQITALGTLPGSQISQPFAVNNRSQVVGGSRGDAFLWSAGTMTDLGRLPGAQSSEAHAVNNAGTVVGNDSGGSNEAFIWDARLEIRSLGVLDTACDTPFSDARGINNHGEVVGYSCVSGTTTPSHAFVWDVTSGMRDLNRLVSLPVADVLSVAYGINERGQIVGNGIFEGATHAFLLDPAE